MLQQRELLLDAERYYHDLLWADHLSSTVEGLGAFSGGRRRTLLRPVITCDGDLGRHGAAAQSVAQGVAIAARHLIERPALRRQIGLPAYLDAVIDLEPPNAPGSVFARLDALLEDETLQVIEYNSEPGSVHQLTMLISAFEALPITRAFRQRFPCRPVGPAHLLRESLRRESLRTGGPPEPRVVVVCDANGSPQAARHTSASAQFGPMAAPGVEIAPIGELEHTRDRLHFRDRPVDVIVLQAWMDLLTSPDSCRAVVTAIQAGHVRVAGGLSKGVLCSYKHLFELLSDSSHASLFPSAVLGALRTHVPWTRVVRDCRTMYRDKAVDLLPLLEQYRERFVLKPGGARGGAGVVLGWRTDQATWIRTLAAAANRYVAQERVMPEGRPYPLWNGASAGMSELTSDYCPYLLSGGVASGCAARVSDNDLHNATLGAINAPVWVLRS